jgi:hypothetical protein
MRIKFDLYCDGFINTITLENKMLLWRDLVLHGLSKEYPKDIVYLIVRFLHRESITQRIEESRSYHIEQGKILRPLNERVCRYTIIMDELEEKWDLISPKYLENKYYDIWRWSRFVFPYMNFVYSFNRGRIFLRFLKGHGMYDIDSEDNIVDRLTDYEEI